MARGLTDSGQTFSPVSGREADAWHAGGRQDSSSRLDRHVVGAESCKSITSVQVVFLKELKVVHVPFRTSFKVKTKI